MKLWIIALALSSGSAMAADQYRSINLEDLHLDIRGLHHAGVITRGEFHQLDRMAWLTEPRSFLSKKAFFEIPLNISRLARDRRKALLECDECTVTVKGRVEEVDLQAGIIVEAVSTRDQ